MARTVTGHLEHPNTLPWVNAIVTFTLQSYGYTDSTVYPQDVVEAETDEFGNFQAELWENQSGSIPTHYVCRLPSGEQVSFVLPEGSAELSLSQIFSLSIPAPTPIVETQLSIIESLIDSHVAQHSSDLEAHPSLVEMIEAISGSAMSHRDTIAISSNQTVFNLAQPVTNPSLAMLFVNSEKMHYGTDYLLDNSTLTWTSPTLTLEPSDTMELFY